MFNKICGYVMTGAMTVIVGAAAVVSALTVKDELEKRNVKCDSEKEGK